MLYSNVVPLRARRTGASQQGCSLHRQVGITHQAATVNAQEATEAIERFDESNKAIARFDESPTSGDNAPGPGLASGRPE